MMIVTVQDAKVDVAKPDKMAAAGATTAAVKQNGLDIVSITYDGCEIDHLFDTE